MIDTTKIINKVPFQVLSVLEHIQYEGYKAYLVGGSVRDILLGREPHDFDIATSAPLKVLQSLFSDCKVVGASFGVVLVKVDGLEMQIARFRIEQSYSDYRHPDSVNFTDDISEDLQRRDFTLNAMAWNLQEFIYVDGALNDLKCGIIRAVGNSEQRFFEDALRMTRAIRFACQLNFTIEPNTSLAIGKNNQLIKQISMERIQEELNKILLSNYPDEGMILLSGLHLLNHIIPELNDCRECSQNIYHKWNVFDHILNVLKLVPNDLSLRLTALFHDIGKPRKKTIDCYGNIHFYGHDESSAAMTKEIMTRLKYDNKIIDEVVYLIRNHMELMNYPMAISKGIRKLLNKHGEERLRKLIEFRRADLIGSGTRDQKEVEKLIQSYRDKLEEVLKEKPATKFEDLMIDGNDIMEALNLKPCRLVGDIKNKLMNLVIDDPTINNKEELLWILNEIVFNADKGLKDAIACWQK